MNAVKSEHIFKVGDVCRVLEDWPQSTSLLKNDLVVIKKCIQSASYVLDRGGTLHEKYLKLELRTNEGGEIYFSRDALITHIAEVRDAKINPQKLKTEQRVATKHDNAKPDLSLLPTSAKNGIAKAFMDGEKKYGRYNYLQGMEWTRILAAAERHLSAFNDGEDVAEDSNLNHLYHAGACICMLIEYYEKQLGTDNRYKKDKK